MIRFADDPLGATKFYEPLGATLRWFNLYFYTELNTEYKICASVDANSYWKIFNTLNPTPTWYILAHLDRETTWKNFNSLTPTPTWKIFSQIDQSTLWKIFCNLDRDIAWKIFHQMDRQSLWKIFTDLDVSTMWVLVGPAYIPISTNRCKSINFHNVVARSGFDYLVKSTDTDEKINTTLQSFSIKAIKRII